MSDWKDRIQKAKDLLDMGVIDQPRFEQMKEQIITEIGLSTGGAPSSDPLAGATMIGSMSTTMNDDPLAGATRIGGFTTENVESTNIVLQVGSNIGQYTILGEIGKGGMGSVYRARHRDEEFAKHTGDVAIKVMNLGLSDDSTFRTRFMAEAGLGRSIRHPNFVAIHDVLMEQNSVALVMDLVEGKPLSDIIANKVMNLPEALPIIESLCNALDHLHGKGIVHRDMKPDNIIITPSGAPVILDMGIAKNSNQTESSQTSTGLAMGTPLYMAPEQLNAKTVTGSADRYALGLIVYEMLSGKLPWDDGLGQGDLLLKKFSGDLHPLFNQPKYIQDAVMGLLRPKVTDRWDSCAAFLAAMNNKASINLSKPQLSKPQEDTEDKLTRLKNAQAERLEKARLEKLKTEEIRLAAEKLAAEQLAARTSAPVHIHHTPAGNVNAVAAGSALLYFFLCTPAGFSQWNQGAKGWTWVVAAIFTGGLAGWVCVVDYWMCFSVQQKRPLEPWEFFPRS